MQVCFAEKRVELCLHESIIQQLKPLAALDGMALAVLWYLHTSIFFYSYR